MSDFIVIAIIAIVVGAAISYIIKEKKRGVKCIGCPYSSACGGNCHSQKE